MSGRPREVFVVDKEKDGLRLASEIGAVPIDFSQAEPVESILDVAESAGTEKGTRPSGIRLTTRRGDEHPELVLDNLVKVVRTAGVVGVVGVYLPEDPGAADERARDGRIGFDDGAVLHELAAHGDRAGAGRALQL